MKVSMQVPMQEPLLHRDIQEEWSCGIVKTPYPRWMIYKEENRNEGSQPHIWLPSRRVLYWKDEHSCHLNLKASGLTFRSSMWLGERQTSLSEGIHKMLWDPGQKQQVDRSLGHTYLLTMDSILKRQEPVHPGDIDTGSSSCGSSFYHMDISAGKHHLESFLQLIIPKVQLQPGLVVCRH